MMSEDNVTRLIQHGENFFAQENYEAALRHFESALQKDPDNLQALNNMGVTLFQLGQYEEVVPIFLKSLALDSMNADVVYNLLACFEIINDWNAVDKIFREFGHALSEQEQREVQEKIDNNLQL